MIPQVFLMSLLALFPAAMELSNVVVQEQTELEEEEEEKEFNVGDSPAKKKRRCTQEA
jgi:hypothetical protein